MQRRDVTLGVVSDSNPTAFTTPSTLTPFNLSLMPGQSGTSALAVSAKTTALNNAANITVVRVTANGHSSPANVSVTTTVIAVTPGASLLHNSVNTDGEVIDFLDLYWRNYHWPAFNIADSFITVGVTIALYCLYKHEGADPFAGA